MKKIFAFCTLIILALSAPLSGLAAPAKDLKRAISNTFILDFVAKGESEFSFGEKISLNADSEVIYNGDLVRSESTVSLDFSFDEFSEIIGMFLGSRFSDFGFLFKARALNYIDMKEEHYYTSLNDVFIEFSGSDESFIEGLNKSTEFVKLFTERFYKFDDKKIQEILKVIFEGENIPFGGVDLVLSREEQTRIFQAIVESGFFQIQDNGRNYTLELTRSPEKINFEVFVPIIIDMYTLNEEGIKGLNEGLKEFQEQQKTEEFKEEWNQMHEFIDFSFIIDVVNAKIAGGEIKIALGEKDSQLPLFLIDGEFTFNYTQEPIVLPQSDVRIIDVTTIIKGFSIMEENF